ncbi:hypothetical protein SCLCIDRAFT_787824 [Scleroderma citrinum Foug A]|uniref:Uncharacterized protein n=1 Tax=Scleroderma citrinum Foug A TaxID=1036808 RepID=A0A0C3ACQ1_9AGAM|nr:hypothetical protein SCLCIDRAFT_787824 [Scleroderma citrinum Foug A]
MQSSSMLCARVGTVWYSVFLRRSGYSAGSWTTGRQGNVYTRMLRRSFDIVSSTPSLSNRDILRILEALVAVEEYREEVRGVYVGQDTDAGAGSGTGEAAGEGVQQDISLEKERTRVEVVKATQIIDTLKDTSIIITFIHPRFASCYTWTFEARA